MSITTRWHQIDGMDALDIEGAGIGWTLLPSLGAKVISLRSELLGQELLWRTPGRRFRRQSLDADFESADLSGWDECFPSIGPGLYPDYPWRGALLADHGELWTAGWECQVSPERVSLVTHGVRFPYRFEKMLEPAGPGIWRLRYILTNLTDHALWYVWASHPLFAARPGMRVLLPDPGRLSVAFSEQGDLGPLLMEHPWPQTTSARGELIDLSTVPAAPRADKLFTSRGVVDWCALHEPATGMYVGFAFDPELVTHVGIWRNSGAWPPTGPAFHVALEPGRGKPDWLETAVLSGDACVLSPRERQEWTVLLCVGRSHTFAGLTREGTIIERDEPRS